MKNITRLLALGISIAGLSACGGSSDSSSSTSTGGTTVTATSTTLPSNQAVDTGSASPAFAASSNGVGYIIASLNPVVTGNPTALNQSTTDGAMTTISGYSLTGSPMATQDISGNASYALGRWSYGTLNISGGTTGTMNGTTNAFWHYAVFNLLSSSAFANAVSSNTSYTCNTGNFTEPSYLGNVGATPLFLGTSTGRATLSFNSTGAIIAVSITTTNGTSSGTNLVNATLTSANASWTTTTPTASTTTLSDAGNGNIGMTGYYQNTLANGALYQGVFQFTCTP